MIRTACVCWLIFASCGTSGARDNAAKPAHNEELRRELLNRVKEDQAARKEVIKVPPGDSPAARKMTAIDRKNTARMKEILDKHGWPGKRLVGDDGAHAAWLLVQHADLDREFQKRCLKLLEKAVKASEASGADLAYLTDRVRVAENKKQIYGTQFKLMDGKLEPFPIEDAANVDRRRKEVGLPSLAEYRKTLEEVYKPKTSKERLTAGPNFLTCVPWSATIRGGNHEITENLVPTRSVGTHVPTLRVAGGRDDTQPLSHLGRLLPLLPDLHGRRLAPGVHAAGHRANPL